MSSREPDATPSSSLKREVPGTTKEEQGSPKKAKREEAEDGERAQLEKFLQTLRTQLDDVTVIEDRDRIQSKAIDDFLKHRAESLVGLVRSSAALFSRCILTELPKEKVDKEIEKFVANYQS